MKWVKKSAEQKYDFLKTGSKLKLMQTAYEACVRTEIPGKNLSRMHFPLAKCAALFYFLVQASWLVAGKTANMLLISTESMANLYIDKKITEKNSKNNKRTRGR